MAAENRQGQLVLIPTPLGPEAAGLTPPVVVERITRLRHFVVENLRSARRALRAMGFKEAFDDVQMQELPRDVQAVDWLHFLKPTETGQDIGLMSEAGAPGIADPGESLVRLAHELRIRVVPLVGVSAITLALMASGLNGQDFCFHGYLPIKEKDRRQALRELERKAASGQTQLFIEAPYRNNQMMQALLNHCQHDTLVCVACDLTQPGEFIATRSLAVWRQALPELNKRPTVFLIGR